MGWVFRQAWAEAVCGSLSDVWCYGSCSGGWTRKCGVMGKDSRTRWRPPCGLMFVEEREYAEEGS